MDWFFMVGSRSMADDSWENGSEKLVWMWLMFLQIFWLLLLMPSSFCLRFWQMSSLRLSSSSRRLIDEALGILQLQLYMNNIIIRPPSHPTTTPPLYSLAMKDEIITIRYCKKIQIEACSASRNNFHQQQPRKESADYNTESFKHVKYLPRLHTREHPYKRVNISTDMRKMPQVDKSDCFTSLKKQAKSRIRFDCQSEPTQKFHVCSKQGKRNYHQDRYICRAKNSNIYSSTFGNKQTYDLYAIFDGHGGANCAEYLKDNFAVFLSRSKMLENHPQQALKQAFQKCEEKFLELCECKQGKQRSGSCAVVCLVVGERVITANLGDSRAIMVSNENVLQLTRDHKPYDMGEKMRIIMHGGKIYKEQEGVFKQIKLFRQFRILPGNLNVSRTIGDIEVKVKKYGGLPGMISAVPDILAYEKDNYDILILGSDGLFEAFTNQQIRQFYSRVLAQHQGLARDKLLKIMVELLCEQALSKSSDNVTVIGVLLS